MFPNEFVPLILPTFVSAVAVFIVSSIVHMVVRWHASDQSKLPNEDAIINALSGAAPGEYRFPWANDMAHMKDPAYLEKAKRAQGVVGVYMGADMQKGFMRALILWFVYSLVVNFLSGHIAHAALHEVPPGHGRALIFHTVGLSAFLGYGVGLAQQSIWGPKKWWPTVKGMIDALVYAAATGGVYVWLWPK